MNRGLLLVLLLAGCTSRRHSVDWFARHPEDAALTINRCVVHARWGPDCDAAVLGKRQLDNARLEKLRKSF